MKHVSAKLAKMRKAQEFIVYPQSTSGDTDIIVQSGKSIGKFNPETGQGVLNTKGQYFYHLALATPYQFPAEFVEACVQAQPRSGDLIGSSSITGPVYVS